jgi:MFS family permease
MDTSIGRRTVRRLLAAKALRAFADGYVALLLPAYLLERGFTPLAIGLVATATLAGSGLATLAIGRVAHRFAYRDLLLAACALMAATGVGFALSPDFAPLLAVAFVGTLNPSSGDVSVFLPLEHAWLSRATDDRGRTAAFARYSLVGALAGATGSLAAGAPALLARAAGMELGRGYQAMFLLYAVVALVAAALYRGLPRVEPRADERRHAALGPSRSRVHALAALFSVDAFAGGLIVQSMLALWLYRAHGLTAAAAGTLFFWTGLLSAASFLAAVPVSRRIGLVNTMVFTHVPSSVCLILVPFAPGLPAVVALLLVRSALSQIDVPTRSSYVMAIVTPAERPAAASVTTVPRSLAAAASPFLSGYLLGLSAFGWPLVAAGTLKIAYDLALLAMFGKVRPPEEARPDAGAGALGPVRRK